jgi:hypothetical protein
VTFQKQRVRPTTPGRKKKREKKRVNKSVPPTNFARPKESLLELLKKKKKLLANQTVDWPLLPNH